MIAVHALWSLDSELCFWAEESSLPATAGRRPGRPPAAPRPRVHPFACGTDALREALARVGAGAATAPGRDRRLALRLPSSELGPQASPHLLRVVDDGEWPDRPSRLDLWEVPAVGVPPAAAIDLLLSLAAAAPARVALGESVRYLTEACKLARSSWWHEGGCDRRSSAAASSGWPAGSP